MALRFVQLLIIFVLALATYKRVLASDPDILSYYVVPENNKVDANFSIYTGFQDIFDDVPGTLNITKAALAEFPALNGQNVSYAMLKYPANEDSPDWKEFKLQPIDKINQILGNLPSENINVHKISLETNFLNLDFFTVLISEFVIKIASNAQTIFILTPTLTRLNFYSLSGLGHCQYNSYANLPAYADSAFGSANAGTVSVLIYMFVFGTGIDNAILAKSLKTMLVPKEAQGWPHHS
ncbi:unnamed protein product [Prunus armeniaca]